MPAQKRSMPENLHDRHQFTDHRPSQPKQSRRDEQELEQTEDEQDQEQPQEQTDSEPKSQVEGDGEQVEDGGDKDEEEDEEDDDDDEGDDDAEGKDSDESESSTSQETPEFVSVELPEIRKEVQCPICLGIIKKTRTVMECLHRFCRECIDKSMRMGNNECPACRTHCASRRSLRDDPNYDALIAALYPDIDKYEEEELAFHEEERTRNKQIQASIAQIFQRQSEALMVKRRVSTRSQRNQRSAQSRRRRNTRVSDHHGSDDNEDENNDNGSKGSSSSEEPSSEMRQRQRKRRKIRSSQPCSSAINSDAGCIENDTEVSRDSLGISPGLVWTPEMLAWGRGGARSHTRHGNSSSGKNSRLRLNRLAEYLRCLQENNDELDIHLKLISVDKESACNLKQPYICCRPNLSVKQLHEYIALKTPLQAEEVEIFLAKEESYVQGDKDDLNLSISADGLRIVESQETLGGLKDKSPSSNYLILAYRRKQSS